MPASLEIDGTYGVLESDPNLERVARSILTEHPSIAVQRHRRKGELVTLKLGEPPLGALQLRFAPGRAPDEAALTQLASFAVRAAHALRSSERAREAGFELERSRALLAVVGEAIARLSLSHTLDTALERLGEHARHRPNCRLSPRRRPHRGRREPGRRRAARSRSPAVLLAIALASRQAGGVVEVDDASTDDRLGPARAQVAESGIDSALALPLVVGDEPIGLLAVYPRRPRPLSANERALLVALAAQLAVAVQNARLHERATALGRELEEALGSEREAAKRLNAPVRDLALVRAEPLARDDPGRARGVDRRRCSASTRP